MKKLQLGIIGMGEMGSQYAAMTAKGEISGVELAAVTRIRKERREWAGAFLPKDLPVFQDGEELLEAANPDAVIIATPHYLHEQYAVMAMKKGIHVMCEKPAGVYTLQAERMNEEAGKHRAVFAMMFQQRTFPIYRKLKEIADGEIYGPLRRVSWMITDWYRPESYYRKTHWRASWETDGGGVLLNQSIHNLDLLQWICGMPCRVQGFCQEGKWHPIPVEDEVTAYLEFPGGATGVFVASTGDFPGKNRLELDFERAQIVCEHGRLHIFSSEDKKTVSCTEIIPDQQERAYQTMLENFAGAIEGREHLIADGTEGIRSLMLCNAMYLSSWTGNMVELPLDGAVFWRELRKKFPDR